MRSGWVWLVSYLRGYISLKCTYCDTVGLWWLATLSTSSTTEEVTVLARLAKRREKNVALEESNSSALQKIITELFVTKLFLITISRAHSATTCVCNCDEDLFTGMDMFWAKHSASQHKLTYLLTTTKIQREATLVRCVRLLTILSRYTYGELWRFVHVWRSIVQNELFWNYGSLVAVACVSPPMTWCGCFLSDYKPTPTTRYEETENWQFSNIPRDDNVSDTDWWEHTVMAPDRDVFFVLNCSWSSFWALLKVFDNAQFSLLPFGVGRVLSTPPDVKMLCMIQQ